MGELTLIKLGGSLITDKTKPFYARERLILRLAKQIKEVRGKLPEPKMIIGHGSGSFGHTLASRFQTQKGVVNRKSLYGLAQVGDAARELNMILVKNFLKVSLPAFSYAPASFILSENRRPHEFFLKSIWQSLKLGLLPVVYGDVILDSKIGCCIFSTEKVLGILAINFKKHFKTIRIIHCGETEGIYGEDGKTIPLITRDSFKMFKKSIGGSGATDVTGGMLHKVEESLTLTESGIPSLIINGRREGELVRALLGKPCKGTKIQ